MHPSVQDLQHQQLGIPSSWITNPALRRDSLFSYLRQKNPPKEGFLLFLSGTARGCLVLSRGCLVQAVWHSVLSYCSFTSVIITSQCKAQLFPQHQRVVVTLNRTISTYFSLKCISQGGTRKVIKSQC